MKRIIFVLCLIAAFITVNIYVKYELSPIEYIKYSMPLTESERELIEENGSFIYGADKSAYPISFYNTQTARLDGIITDYFSYLSIEFGIKTTPVSLNWNEVLDSLDSGEIMTADLFDSPEREKKFDFSEPLYDLSTTALIRYDKDSDYKIQSLDELREKKVALVSGDYSEEYLIKELDWKPENITEAATIQSAVEMLGKGEISAVIGDEVVLKSFYNPASSTEDCYLLGTPIYVKSVSFAVRKGDNQLLSILNKFVLKLKKDDVISKTHEKWYVKTGPIIRDSLKYELIFYFVIIAAAIMFLVNRWNYVLRVKVRESTQQLEDSKNNIKNIIDGINLGIVVTDEKGTIFENNLWIEHLENKTRNEIVGQNINCFEKTSLILSDHVSVSSYVTEVNNKYYHVTNRLLKQSTGKKYLSVVEDITEKIINDRVLRQQSKMVAIGHLAAGLAHEIRNPLGIIKNYLFFIRSVSEDVQIENALAECDSSVKRINDLITTLLNFSKKSGGTSEVLDLKQIIEEIISLEKKQADKHNIKIECVCQHVLFNGNKESMRIIIMNLLDNAVEALSSQDKNAGLVRISCCQKNDIIYLTVSDNGKQIDEKVTEQIFNPFYTTKDNGTGLGLFLVNNEVEKLGGEIKLSYSEGFNSFKINFHTDI